MNNHSAIPKTYPHQQADAQWYQHAVNAGYYHSQPDERQPYTVVIPPPNVTGILHMGHCLNNTIQDILVRRARQEGKNACWVPGTDHASIATEAKVVQMLREQGIAKSSLSREAFLEHAWAWKEKYGGIILQQLKHLGCSLDWNRVHFTMDPAYYKSVIGVFIELYNQGLIYRGKRMINWDPKAKTALSDEEVIMRETQSKLYHLRYYVADENNNPASEYITIATVRPETILGDTAVAVHPEDERYSHLVGKKVLVPLINRAIPVIADDYVDKAFGTGALKVTPAHDKNDDQLGQKHGLQVIDIMNDDGTFSPEAQLFVGEDRFVVRKKIVPLLEEAGHLVKTEDYVNQVGYSERSDAVVEPRLSMQWWVKMQPLAQPALQAVMDGQINFHPAKFKNLYQHWMENIKDWCISRQLWWGHRIPAWYLPNGTCIVAETAENAWEKYAAGTIELNEQGQPFTMADLQQDPDCLDTWFSSWLWPFEVFEGYSNPNNEQVNYYYPTASLVTAPEIIFFWVARMIMAGLHFKQQIPFKDVYFTGIVRDEKGRKMSKQLGNSPDLLALIDKYGADAVRFGILISSPAGNDLLFDVKEESTLKQGSFFVNKMWNALKLIDMWRQGQPEAASTPVSAPSWAHQWLQARLGQATAEISQLMAQFRLSEALKAVYTLVWDDFCSWYLEWVKPPYGQQLAAEDIQQVIRFYEQLLLLLHPFMPFVTEEIYHQLSPRTAGDDLTVKTLRAQDADSQQATSIIADGQVLKQIITALRDARNKQQLKPKDTINIDIETNRPQWYQPMLDIIQRQVNAQLQTTPQAQPGGVVVAVEQDKFYLRIEGQQDATQQKESLEKDLAYQQQFLQSVIRKLQNERFVQNAKPEVVAAERKKQTDAEARIAALEEALKNLGA